MVDMMKNLVGDRVEAMGVKVEYAVQDFSSVPSFYEIPADRTKPFGTCHAVLCAADVVKEPFCVINADDYYGMDAYTAIYDALLQLPEQGKATMVGYLLKNTASLHGTVSRGVCEVDGDKLCAVHETKKIQLYADGTLKDLERDRELNPESVVSMNFWGFMPSIFGTLKDYFDYFLRELADKIVTVHVSDYDFINERHWLPGEGKVDWQEVIAILTEIGYDGPWLYEMGLVCPKTILRDRDLRYTDLMRNARELFTGQTPTIFSRPKPNLGWWE
jgi:hypothetical protein